MRRRCVRHIYTRKAFVAFSFLVRRVGVFKSMSNPKVLYMFFQSKPYSTSDGRTN